MLYVLDPAVQRAELECYNWISERSALPTSYHLPALFGMDSVEKLTAPPAGIVVLGSSSSVHDALPWQAPFHQWLKQQIERGIPTLGICYGHQLISHLHGAKVIFRQNDQAKRVGFYSVSLRANRLWGDRERTGEMFFSHREVVSTCPEGFEVLAHQAESPFEALAHRTLPVWSFQAHPEASSRFLNNAGMCNPVCEAKLSFGHDRVAEFLDFVASKAVR